LSGNRRAYQEEIKKKIIENIDETIGKYNKRFYGDNTFRFTSNNGEKRNVSLQKAPADIF
jgi:hypothetical protein